MRKIQCEACAVRHQGGVCDLPPGAMDDFRAAGSSAIYKPRQVLFTEGGPTTGLFILCHGLVKLYHSDRFGRDHILEVAGPGAVLGELPLSGDGHLSVSAEAVTESQLCFLQRDRLVTFLQLQPLTGMRLIAALSSELALARRKVRDLALKGAESRLASLLVQLARTTGDLASGQRVPIRYTRRELAEMIGVSTETAIRLLAKLKKKRAISVERRDIVIADPEKLNRVASFDETDP